MHIQSHKNIIVTCRYVAQTGYENSSEIHKSLVANPSTTLHDVMDWALKTARGENLVSVSVSLSDTVRPLNAVSVEIPVGPAPRPSYPNEKQKTVEEAATPL